MAAMKISHLNFHDEVLRSDKKVLLDFWAPWCGPCRMVSPVIDEEPELAQRFGVMSIPTLVVMENGRVISQSSGARPKAAILSML